MRNFSKTLLLTNLSKFIFLQKSTPFPNSFQFKFYPMENEYSKFETFPNPAICY